MLMLEIILYLTLTFVNGGVIFNDELWPKQWYLNPDLQGDHMDIVGAWEQGYTGKGVTVAVVDDGLEHSHPDLVNNYNSKASIDIDTQENDPSPRSWNDWQGTRGAGIIGAEGNNSIGIVGVAPNVEIGGIRLATYTDKKEAEALSSKRDIIDIYSMAWGPTDDGEALSGPGELAYQALEEGVNFGRDGKVSKNC